MLFFNCSVVFAGFSSEALASRINDGKLKICVLFFKPSISQLVGKNIALLNFVMGVHFFFKSLFGQFHLPRTCAVCLIFL